LTGGSTPSSRPAELGFLRGLVSHVEGRGGPFQLGGDAGSSGWAERPLGVFGYGATLHGELKLLVEAGPSPTQALVDAAGRLTLGVLRGQRSAQRWAPPDDIGFRWRLDSGSL
jgi:hypothetical protein